jgi:hypothetical protein
MCLLEQAVHTRATDMADKSTECPTKGNFRNSEWHQWGAQVPLHRHTGWVDQN